MDLMECLESLCGAAGAGGLEEAAHTAAECLKAYADDVQMDALGNVTGIRRCGTENAPVILLEAHIDEIGFIVTGVDDQGFVHVSPCGGVDRRTLAAAEVVIWADKPYPGVFCSTPPHLSSGTEALGDISDMGIDVGMDAKKARQKILPGTRVTFRPDMRTLTDTRVSSKSLDDRAGVASILYCLDQLGDKPLAWDVAVAFAVQEELGCRGSATAAYALKPDRAIAVDVSFALTPHDNPAKCGLLGKGPMIGYAPGLDSGMTRCLDALAEERGIPHQSEVMGGDTGTDADSISGVRDGVPTALLSIPLRYMHTPIEVVDIRDVENVGKLMAEYIMKEGAVK